MAVWTSPEEVPDWVQGRRKRATRELKFAPPRRTKALPLSLEYLADALQTLGTVLQARELDGLDVWFVCVLRPGSDVVLELVLYEHMGEWECSSIRKF
jgi:hypothetical protein